LIPILCLVPSLHTWVEVAVSSTVSDYFYGAHLSISLLIFFLLPFLLPLPPFFLLLSSVRSPVRLPADHHTPAPTRLPHQPLRASPCAPRLSAAWRRASTPSSCPYSFPAAAGSAAPPLPPPQARWRRPLPARRAVSARLQQARRRPCPCLSRVPSSPPV